MLCVLHVPLVYRIGRIRIGLLKSTKGFYMRPYIVYVNIIIVI